MFQVCLFTSNLTSFTMQIFNIFLRLFGNFTWNGSKQMEAAILNFFNWILNIFNTENWLN